MSAISEIMSKKQVITIRLESGKTAKDVARIMTRNNVGSVIAINKKGEPAGIITERDMLKRVSLKDIASSRVKVEDIISSPLITVMSYDSVDTAARVMTRNKIKRLAVLEPDGKVAGIISTSDITKNLAKVLTDDYDRYRSLRFAIDLEESD